jgi:hypothetical protein
MEYKKYLYYTKINDMNIIGIRANIGATNTFNDYITVSYVDEGGVGQCKIYMATTDPGKYYLNHPMNIKGTAILKPGQYRNMWKVGLHHGYRALVQHGICTVYRDINQDDQMDMYVEESGNYGINLHHAGNHSETVDKWSAGCQVIAVMEGFNELMDLVDKQIAAGLGDIFTYTLLEEKDFK